MVPDLTSLATSYVLVCAYNQAQSAGTIPTTATVVGKANYLVAGAPTLRLTASGGRSRRPRARRSAASS